MIPVIKNIGLVAHDRQKKDLVEWTFKNINKLKNNNLICTGTTGFLINEMLLKEFPNLSINILQLKSGPLGGDQQMGALIVENKVNILIFLTDPMSSQPHDVDVKALTRIASIYNIPFACNLASADFLINSSLFNTQYIQKNYTYSDYVNREVK